MRNLAILSSFLLILFFTSCNLNEPTSPNGDDQQSGKLFLKIDKANAPPEVFEVDAFLSREGFDTLTGSMNLLSDSTAEILFENINAGTWHLRIDAVDSSNVVLYTGETDVSIMAGFTTQVSLVLEPTGAGTGNVNIFVTWGTIYDNWSDFSGNPVLSSSGSFYEANGVGQAYIIFINNIYRMWYEGDAGGSNTYVLYAESIDGIVWDRPISNPVLSPGPQGSWDDLSVHPGAIIYDDGMYYMFYSGFSDPLGRWDIGFAESVDGISWIKHPTPVLYGTSGWEYQIGPSSVIKIEDTYYLYYYMRDLPYFRIGLATSTDRINWERNVTNPILTFDTPWESTGVYYPTVYAASSGFEMIYMNGAATGFGKATSSDGINWQKKESNPFFTKYDTFNNWAYWKIAYPFYIKVNNSDRVYYTGFSTGNFDYKIGFVTK